MASRAFEDESEPLRLLLFRERRIMLLNHRLASQGTEVRVLPLRIMADSRAFGPNSRGLCPGFSGTRADTD